MSSIDPRLAECIAEGANNGIAQDEVITRLATIAANANGDIANSVQAALQAPPPPDEIIPSFTPRTVHVEG